MEQREHSDWGSAKGAGWARANIPPNECFEINHIRVCFALCMCALLFLPFFSYPMRAVVDKSPQVLLGQINAFQGTPVTPKAHVWAREDPLSWFSDCATKVFGYAR